MTEPKIVSDFAKEYKEMYIELTQLRRAYTIVVEQRDKAVINEKMGKEELYYEFADSPKAGLTTNYAIRGQGSSHDARRFELEISQAEKTIADGVEIIEHMGAHPLLTEAQCLLMDAKRKIAEYIDNVLPNSDDARINPPILPYLDIYTKLKGSPKTSLDIYFDGLLKTGSF